jgi:hypothetical protein
MDWWDTKRTKSKAPFQLYVNINIDIDFINVKINNPHL